MTTKQKPVHNIQLGRIKGAIWANNSNGKGVRYNVTVTRSYLVGEVWKDSSSFGRDELLLVIKVLDQAHTWICQQARKAAA